MLFVFIKLNCHSEGLFTVNEQQIATVIKMIEEEKLPVLCFIGLFLRLVAYLPFSCKKSGNMYRKWTEQYSEY